MTALIKCENQIYTNLKKGKPVAGTAQTSAGSSLDMGDIGKSIQKARQLRDVSQRRLAKYIGVSQAAISYIESGENIPELPTLQLISRALNVDFIISAEKDTDLSIKDMQVISRSLEDLINRHGLQITMPTGTMTIASGTACKVVIPETPT